MFLILVNMKAYIIKAPRRLGSIPEGYVIQVVSDSTGGPRRTDIEKALVRAGFVDSQSLSYSASGNWKIEEL